MVGFKWKCRVGGKKHDSVPNCFGIEAPWRAFVPDDEFDLRVKLSKDQCVIDEAHFFIRGHIELPILGTLDSLTFSVWSSLSEKSFYQMSDHWDEADRGEDAPYFGWLSSPISPYSDALNLPLSVQTSSLGLVPLFTVTQSDHPLAIDQKNGISVRRWHEITLAVMS
jgi:hypothetical protein